MTHQLRLLNTKMVEKNNICLMLSLYLHTLDNGKGVFSYYSDYIGFGIDETEVTEDGIPKTGDVLSGTKYVYQGIPLESEEIQVRTQELIEEMEEMEFEDTFQIISNYQNQIFV